MTDAVDKAVEQAVSRIRPMNITVTRALVIVIVVFATWNITLQEARISVVEGRVVALQLTQRNQVNRSRAARLNMWKVIRAVKVPSGQ